VRLIFCAIDVMQLSALGASRRMRRSHQRIRRTFLVSGSLILLLAVSGFAGEIAPAPSHEVVLKAYPGRIRNQDEVATFVFTNGFEFRRVSSANDLIWSNDDDNLNLRVRAVETLPGTVWRIEHYWKRRSLYMSDMTPLTINTSGSMAGHIYAVQKDGIDPAKHGMKCHVEDITGTTAADELTSFRRSNASVIYIEPSQGQLGPRSKAAALRWIRPYQGEVQLQLPPDASENSKQSATTGHLGTGN